MSRVTMALHGHLVTVEDTDTGRVWSGAPRRLLDLCQAIELPPGYYPDITYGIAQAVAKELDAQVVEWVPNPPDGLPPGTVY